jgi:hypothetical protein
LKTDAERLAAYDFVATLKCDTPFHADGAHGCVPDQPGAWLCEIRHTGHPNVRRFVACPGYVIRFWSSQMMTISCSCGWSGVLSEYMHIIEPI